MDTLLTLSASQASELAGNAVITNRYFVSALHATAPLTFFFAMVVLFSWATTPAASAQCGDPPFTMATWARDCSKYGGTVSSDGRRCVGWNKNWCHASSASSSSTADDYVDRESRKAHEEQQARTAEQRRREDENIRQTELAKISADRQNVLREKSDALKLLKPGSSAASGLPVIQMNIADVAPLDLGRPVDPREMVTQDLYESEKKMLAHLLEIRQKLESKRDEVRSLQGQLRVLAREDQLIRAETVGNELSDVLQAVPAAETLELLSANPEYAKVLTPQRVDAFKTAWEHLQVILENMHGVPSEAGSLQLKETLDVTRLLQKDLITILGSRLPINDPARIWAERLDKSFKVFSRSVEMLSQQEGRGQPVARTVPIADKAAALAGALQPWADAAADISGVLYPPLSVGIGFKDLAQKEYYKRRYLDDNTNDIENALSKDFEAERFLNDRMAHIEANIAMLRRDIDSYESLRAKAEGH